MPPNLTYSRLQPGELTAFRQLNAMFAASFDDAGHYLSAPPSDAYIDKTLAKPHVIALVAQTDSDVIGGLVAYELAKLEQNRREIYIYDLAVDPAYRRQGVATALIEMVRQTARDRQAWMIYVQADHGDDPAVALYTKLGQREDVMHFDIDP